MRRWSVISRNIESWIARIASCSGYLMVPLVLVTIFDVVTRKFFTLGSTGFQELEWHFHTLVFCGILAFVIQADRNVRIDIFYDQFSVRKKAWIDVLGYLLFALPFLGTIFIFALHFVVAAYTSGEGSFSTQGIPHRWLIKSALLIGIALMLVQVILEIIKRINTLLGHGDTMGLAPNAVDEVSPVDEADGVRQ